MFKPKFVDYDLEFKNLSWRSATNSIVIHHTGNPTNDDLSAEDIHEMHLNNGWAGIGYHFVVRKNGEIELGRPVDCIGAHAEGHNYYTVGIHLSGNFEIGYPTTEQIESAAVLVAWLCERYDLLCNDNNVFGHCDLMATACPGENLYNELPTIIGKANWYQQHYESGEYDGKD